MRFAFLAAVVSLATNVRSQYCDTLTSIHADTVVIDNGVHTFKDFFSKGKFRGHIRNYFMSTINDGSLTDHYANAIGGSIAYKTANWNGFELGINAIYTFNAFSSDLTGTDPNTMAAKWEMELFDIQNPTNKYNLTRLDELYLGYHSKKFRIKAGRMNIDEDPLLKRRDGRMMAFMYQGIWNSIDLSSKVKMYNGFINGVAPRGMTKWYSMNEAIGITNNGMLNDSTKMNYRTAANTKGLLVNGFKITPVKALKIQVWNYYLLHMHNTLWTQVDFNTEKFGIGIQYVLQAADPYQRKLTSSQQYFNPDHLSHSIAFQLQYNFNKKLQFRMAQLFITNDGRFQFPKELTRENFYTSIPRSWMDGLGNLSVSLAGLQFYPNDKLKKDLRFDLIAQYINSPDITDLRMNKYGTPDYLQINFGSRYNFHGSLDGLSINLLYIYRYCDLPSGMSFSKEYYKVNFHHINLIVEFLF